MTWVVFGLVTVAVATFLLYMFAVRFNRMHRHGSVAVPGESVIELPAGRVVVHYEDRFRWRPSDRPRPWDGFSMLVSDEESGERIDLGPPPSETAVKARGRNRIPYGTLELPHAGRYRIRSQIEADATEPRIIFG